HPLDPPSFPTRRSSDLDLVATQRQGLDLVSSQLAGALRHFVQSRRLAFSTSAAAIQPRLIRRRHADLGERLTTLARRSAGGLGQDRKSTRLNSSHVKIS